MTERRLNACADFALLRAAPLVILLLAPTGAQLQAAPPGEHRLSPYSAASVIAAPQQAIAPRAANEIWLIDSRRSDPRRVPPTLIYYRFEAGLWNRVSEGEFLAAQDATKPTCFWVHGNRVTEGAAVDRGLAVYGHVNARATRPFRFVLWSWPSDQVRGPVRDLQFKAQLSDLYALPLARLIDQVDPHVQLGFLGYSYGARLICGALHLQTQRHLVARGLPPHIRPGRAPVSAVLLAAAMDNDSFQPGGRNDQALGQVGRMLITVNRQDPAMKWYRLLYAVPGPDALGYTGAAGIATPAVAHMDVSDRIGRKHDLAGYLRLTDPATWLGLRER